MNEPQLSTPPEVTSSTLPRFSVADPGLVVIPQTVDGEIVMKRLAAPGELELVGINHPHSGQPVTWAELVVTTRTGAVSGWYPGKLGGWVKLEWRDGGFVADAWTSDGAGMSVFDAAARAMAAKKRS